ncbi:MAG: rhodanese-like domain-containing protein [Planctomycetota bacterium]
MSSYLLKVIVIFVISAVGTGVQLWSEWPVQLKADPAPPPVTTLTIPDRPDSQTDAEAGEKADDAAEVSDEQDAPAASAGTITLDGLEIDLPTTKALHENQLATFIDARVSSEFEEGHIEGALNISPAALEANSSLFALDVIDPALPIVIYCGGGDCDDSHRVAELLQDLRGFEQTHVFIDGYQTWADAGLPTSTGPDPFAE